MRAIWTFVIFGIIGMGTEAFFTATVPLILFLLQKIANWFTKQGTRCRGRFGKISLRVASHLNKKINISEFEGHDWKGHVWIGMAAIYGLSAAPFGWLYNAIHSMPLLLRAPIYGAGIMSYELVSGLCVLYGYRALTGKTFYPWRYEKRGNFLHLIYIPYFKYWCVFGLILERLYTQLMN